MIPISEVVPHVTLANGDKILTPFGPMMYRTELPEHHISTLLEEGDRLSERNNDFNFSLAGNFKKGRSLSYSTEFRKAFAPVIMDKVQSFLEGSTKIFGTRLPSIDEVELKSLWINYQKQYDFNPNHFHSDFLSFVIYCDIPEEIFEDQADSNSPFAGLITFNHGEDITPLTNTEFRVRPSNNLMFIFPAKLKHIVYPFFADKVRVSVSGNIKSSIGV